MSENSRARFDGKSNVVLTRPSLADESAELEVVWHGGMKSPLGGFTKGELIDPRNEDTNPMWLMAPSDPYQVEAAL